jgi:para-nitrobenzyl esterase
MQNFKKILFVIALSLLCFTGHSQVKVVNDIVCAIVSDHQYLDYQLKLDVYSRLNKQSEKRPVVILVHGGGFAFGDKQQKLYVEMAYRFAQNNYVVFR